MNEKYSPTNVCDYKNGRLPDCAPLAVSYVPGQPDAANRYESEKALIRGTLFPGLDLPLCNIVNNKTLSSPLAELMAVDFAAHDLSLYLDTHADDAEAFSVYRDLLELSEKGHKKYAERYGPLCKTDLARQKTYNWPEGSWPWDMGTEE